MQNCSIPAARASSIAYWISGLSTTGSISLAMALVAGRNRVPRPGNGQDGFAQRLDHDWDPPGLPKPAAMAGGSEHGRQAEMWR